MKEISKQLAIELASRLDGFSVHRYKWSHARYLKQFSRYCKQGIMTSKCVGDFIIFKTKGAI